jgi:uncharacterized cupin superfamily protein
MQKVNVRDIEELSWRSPSGKFASYGKEISEALGRQPHSTDLLKRHPFDVELLRIPPGATPYPYHFHSAQWEFYYLLSGSGEVRHADGVAPIEAGDAFLFKPGEAHSLTNRGTEDMLVIVIADNPIGEHDYFPDSDKWMVGLPGSRRLLRSEPVDYFDGEE